MTAPDYFVRVIDAYLADDHHSESHREKFLKEGPIINAVEALGEMRAQEGVPILISLLEHENYLCVVASRALADIGDASAVGPLLDVLEDSSKFWVPRGAAAIALGALGKVATDAVPALELALTYQAETDDETWDERAQDAVRDAIHRIQNPGTETTLGGQGYKYEMWGIF